MITPSTSKPYARSASRMTRPTFASLLAGIVVAAASPAADAALLTAYSGGNAGGTFVYTDASNTQGSLAQAGGSAVVGSSAVSGEGSASFGTLKAATHARAAGISPSTTGETIVSWHDKITIAAPNLNGQRGSLTVQLHFDWQSDLWQLLYENSFAQASTSAAIEAIAYGPGGYNQSSRGQAHSVRGAYMSANEPSIDEQISNFSSYNNGMPVDYDSPLLFTVPFIFGQASDFEVRLSVRSTANASGSDLRTAADALLDAAHSAYWGGFDFVMANGGTLSDFSVSSESGTNWRSSFLPAVHPVHEPASLPLVSAMLLSLVLARSRRQA